MNLSLKDKIYGALFGAAIGDALGLGTEFMTREEIAVRYPNGLRRYDDIVRDAHRSLWQRGDWTNDTELVIHMAESLHACDGPDIKDFALRLSEWVKTDPRDLVSCLRHVTTTPGYADDPQRTSLMIWSQNNDPEPSNETLGYSALIGLWDGDAVKNAMEFSLAINCCNLSSATAAAIALSANTLMWREEDPDCEELCRACAKIDEQAIPYLRTARYGRLEELEVDDEDTCWSAAKSMGAALWAIWHCQSPTEVLLTLVDAGGDADTNASLGMMLAGVKYGFDALPKRGVEKLMQRERMESVAARLTETFVKRFNNRDSDR